MAADSAEPSSTPLLVSTPLGASARTGRIVLNREAVYRVLKQSGDCHDREVIGYEFALRSRAKQVERAVEAACLRRFGILRPVGAPVLSSVNGLIFQSRRFRQACR